MTARIHVWRPDTLTVFRVPDGLPLKFRDLRAIAARARAECPDAVRIKIVRLPQGDSHAAAQ